jgi:hypothetical protein
MTTTAVKLACPECRRENEPERIYCHDCGARLDRSAVIKQKGKDDEDPKATQRRLHSMFDPRRAKLRKNFFLVSKVLLSALAVAGVVQMLRSPDLPEAKAGMGALPAQINLDLENASMDPRVGTLRYSEEQVNGYLGYALKSKQAALTKYYLNFDRLVVAFEENACRATVQRSLFGVPLCTTAKFTPQLEKGAISAKMQSGAIGRLSIHPQLMQYGDFLFADVRGALQREQKSLLKLGTVELHPKTVIITANPPQT